MHLERRECQSIDVEGIMVLDVIIIVKEKW